jgi:hypothetical protein
VVGLRPSALTRNGKMHALPWPEGGLNHIVHDEVECVIEVESVGVRRHGNTLDAAPGSDRSSVMHELAADSLPHPLRINEEILKVKDAILEDDGRETHDVVRVGGDSAPPFGDAVPFQNHRRWVGEQSLTVTLVGK